MINAKRGEVLWHCEGRDYRLCLTFGALAELEHYFQTTGMAALAERLSQGSLSARDIIALLAAGLRGADEDLTVQDLERMPVALILPSALGSITAMLEAAFGSPTPGGEETQNPFPGRR
jgi:hypothetical protein